MSTLATSRMEKTEKSTIRANVKDVIPRNVIKRNTANRDVAERHDHLRRICATYQGKSLTRRNHVTDMRNERHVKRHTLLSRVKKNLSKNRVKNGHVTKSVAENVTKIGHVVTNDDIATIGETTDRVTKDHLKCVRVLPQSRLSHKSLINTRRVGLLVRSWLLKVLIRFNTSSNIICSTYMHIEKISHALEL